MVTPLTVCSLIGLLQAGQFTEDLPTGIRSHGRTGRRDVSGIGRPGWELEGGVDPGDLAALQQAEEFVDQRPPDEAGCL